jgi:hypothetical protein
VAQEAAQSGVHDKRGIAIAQQDDETRCEDCGEPARVCVLEGYSSGMPVTRRLCLVCVDQERPQAGAHGSSVSRRLLHPGTLLIIVGVLLAIASTSVDYIGVTGSPGIGGYQLLGLGVGAVCVLFGAMLRIEVLAVAGAFAFGLAACADLLGVTGSKGVGWKEQCGYLVAALLVAGGFLYRRLGRVRSRPVTSSAF